jgi:glyoxylase-like metal-dependent hydrolase (beta-lactamase superfamily II)
VHMLVTADEAGPTPAPYALHGVDLERRPELRPFGWEEDLDFGDRRCAGLRSPAPLWYLDGADARIVVDTGVATGADARVDARSVLRRHGFRLWTEHRPEWTIDAQLARFGVRPEEIDVVISTHFHFDHIGNNTRFANATFLAQRAELEYALRPPPWAQFYYPEFAFNIEEVRARLELLDGPADVADGVRVVPRGGHTPGSQVVLVNTAAGRVCLAGDIVPFYRNLELDWPTGSFFDLEAVVAAHAWMRGNADVVVPQHDWRFFELFPDGVVG